MIVKEFFFWLLHKFTDIFIYMADLGLFGDF